jgi:hypothetical protein
MTITNQGAESAPLGRSPAGIPIHYDQPWLGSLMRPALIAIMVACVDLTLLSFIARVAPFLARSYIPAMIVISVAAALIGCITTTVLAQPTQRHRRTFAYRFAELGLLLALTRVMIWLVTGEWPAPMLFLTQPFDVLFDGLFFVSAFVVTLSWTMATSTTDDLLQMALQPDELYAIEADRIGEMVRTSGSDRPALLRSLVTRWVSGGIFMVMLAAGLGLNLSGGGNLFTLAQDNIGAEVVASIVIYFLAGLILISHGQLALLRSRWTIDRVPNAANVLRNWPLYVLLLLVVMGGVAALMPFGGTFLLAQILGAIIVFLFNLIMELFRLITGLFLWLVSLLTGEAPPQEEAPPPPPPTMPPPEMAQPAAQMPEWAGGVLFWTLMALLLGYAAYIYFSGKGFNFGWLSVFWRMLLARWGQFRGAYQAWIETRLPDSNQATGAVGAGRAPLSRWRQWRKLSPEQQVRYFYLTTLEEAGQHGLARRVAETPHQYAGRLVERLAEKSENPTEAPDEVQTLTEAFVQARYSRRPIDPQALPKLQKVWQSLQQHLRLP